MGSLRQYRYWVWTRQRRHTVKNIIQDAKEQYPHISDNWDHVDLRGMQMLDLTPKLHSARATCELLTNAVSGLLTNAVTNNTNNSNNKGRGGPVNNRRGSPEDWQYVKVCDTKEVRGKIWWWRI